MGCYYSKDELEPNNASRSSRTNVIPTDLSDSDDIRVESVYRYDEQIINVIRRDLTDTPQIFVLNNILLAMQFFENYQKDIPKATNSTAGKLERRLNRSLLQNETMECTSPDVILDKVNRNVLYRPLHGPRKHSAETLAAKRLYVINDTIEVVNSMDIPQYTSIDKPAYQVRMEDSKRKGFVKLKYIDTNKLPKIDHYSAASPEPIAGSSMSSDSDTYTAITELNTPKLLDIIENPERRDTLPMSCFSKVRVKKSVTELLMAQEEKGVELTAEDMFETVTYIDAKGFMNYFKNALFPNSLGRALGFDELEISQARSIPGKIFCNLTDEEDNPVPCEVIPSVAIEWPAEQTFEFVMRENRPTITDRRMGVRYRWPTDDMIKEITSMNCALVPKGYWSKKGNYPDATLEWEIAFPKAERYIEARMSHTQTRCFLFLLALHKTYIDPVTHQHGLLVEHIRCHMYWECEANYRNWPEHRLGSKLKQVITNLIQHLAKCELPDFFIKQKNLFRNIPKKYLLFAQKVFHDILESPALYYVKALRNIRYTSGKFYTPLNFKELYNILTQTQGIKLINPNLPTANPQNLRNKRYNDTETQWRHIHQLKVKEKVLKRKQLEKEDVDELDERKESVDSINLEFGFEHQFDIYKIKAILELFINYFIDIAKDSGRLNTKEQTLFYLKQAWYLARILEITSPSFIVDVRNFKQKILAEEEACKKMAVKEINDLPPTTPVRNSAQFDFTTAQQIKSNILNLNNLHTSYNNVGLKATHSQPTVRRKQTERPPRGNSAEIKLPPRKSVAFVEHG